MQLDETILDKAIRYLEQQQQISSVLYKEPKRPAVTQPVREELMRPAGETPSVLPSKVPAVPEPITTTIPNKRFTMPIRKTDMFEESPEWMNAPDLPVLYEKIHTCLNCALGSTRTKFVFGVGNPNADIMVIGEAPGADEDAHAGIAPEE